MGIAAWLATQIATKCLFLFSFSFSFIDISFLVTITFCAIGGQHDGHLPFSFPGFAKFIMLLLHVLLLAEINILLLLLLLKNWREWESMTH